MCHNVKHDQKLVNFPLLNAEFSGLFWNLRNFEVQSLEIDSIFFSDIYVSRKITRAHLRRDKFLIFTNKLCTMYKEEGKRLNFRHPWVFSRKRLEYYL